MKERRHKTPLFVAVAIIVVLAILFANKLVENIVICITPQYESIISSVSGEIPKHTGEQYVVLNTNIPDFEQTSSKPYIEYTELDSLSRPGAVEKQFELKEISIKGMTNNYFELGTTLTISVHSNYSSNRVSYRFSYQYGNEDTKMISDYTTLNKVDWKPECSGTYLIIAEGMTDAGLYGKTTKEITVINPNKIEIKSIKFNKESPQKIGESITITLAADDGTKPYKYKFDFIQSNNSKENSDSSGWIDDNEYIWVPDRNGTYAIKITVEDSGGQIVSLEKTYDIIEANGTSEQKEWHFFLIPVATGLILTAIVILIINKIKRRHKTHTS